MSRSFSGDFFIAAGSLLSPRSGSASGSSLAGNRLHINKKVLVGTAIVLLVLALGALLLFSASPVGKTAIQPADGPAVGTSMHEIRRNL